MQPLALSSPPLDLASDFAIDVGTGRVIDLCAGIGVLSYFVKERSKWNSQPTEIICVERNHRYVEIGKNLSLMPAGFVPMCSIGSNGGMTNSTARCSIMQSETRPSDVSAEAQTHRATKAQTLNFMSSILLRKWPTTALSSCRSSPQASNIPAALTMSAGRQDAPQTSRN